MTKTVISHILLNNENKSLQNLLTRVSELQQLSILFSELLGSHLAKHCHIARYEQGRLIVITDSGSWTTQLQYQIPRLLEQLREYPKTAAIKAICCKTRPTLSTPSKTPAIRHVARLSQPTAHLMTTMAKEIKDEKLKAALLRIAERCVPPRSP